MRSLLDVNMLIALLDAAHLHHATAAQWWAAHQDEGWASCPLTQNGCLRIMSMPSYLNPQTPASVADRLAMATSHPSHQFWPDSISVLDAGLLKWDRLLSSRQITDIYLLALAVKNNARLVTLDRGISVQAVRGASSKHLLTLA